MFTIEFELDFSINNIETVLKNVDRSKGYKKIPGYRAHAEV